MILYYFVHTHSSEYSKWSLILKTQLDKSGDSRLEASIVICGYSGMNVILASVHEVVVLIWTAHQSSIEYVVVWTRTVECVPVTYGWPGRAQTAKIFIAWDSALIERPCRNLGWSRLSIFVPFLLLFLKRNITFAEWIFSIAHRSFPTVRNWKYAAYRGTSYVPAVDEDTGKEDTAMMCGMTLDGLVEGKRTRLPSKENDCSSSSTI